MPVKRLCCSKHLFYKTMPRTWFVVITGVICLYSCLVNADTPTHDIRTYSIYLDADQTNNTWSGNSIELGIRAAFSEVNWKLGKRDVTLVVKDHHGNTARSQYHLDQLLEDDRALALFGGMHSPPLLAARDTLNKNGVLTFVPWAAATPITRGNKDNNWIFRLSLDDSKAGAVIINDLINSSALKKPFLLLEETGWGKANKKTMEQRLVELNIEPVGTKFFQWGLGQNEAQHILNVAMRQGADSFVLVANAPEGITFAKAMLSLPPEDRKPIRSHWGITGGNFPERVGVEKLAQLDLRFIQSAFSFLDEPMNETARGALNSARKVRNLKKLEGRDIKAPAGFIHAYDITRILITAANVATLSGDIKADRLAIRQALEDLNVSINGLVKNYQRPFSNPALKGNFDAHEALNQEDFSMAKFDTMGNIRLVRHKN